jgi:uncharacterized protein YhbP (UPF0306 family)
MEITKEREMWSTESDLDDSLVQRVVERITIDVLTGAVTTQTADGPWIFTAYLAFRDNCCWFTSQEATRHVPELRENPAVAVAMWKEPRQWGEKLVGLQLSGRAKEVLTETEASSGLEVLHDKFPGTLNTIPSPEAVLGSSKRTCLFMVQFANGTVRDEDSLGKGRFSIGWRS